jgi:hypothetical protein
MGFMVLAVELVALTIKSSAKMSRAKKRFMIVIIAWVSLGAVIAVVRLVRGEGKFIYRAKLTEFFVCEGPDPLTGLPQEPMNTLPSTIETIYACGYLEADGYVPLHFLLFYEGESTKWSNPEENYQTGFIFRELPQSWRKPGNYRVELRLQGHKVAATEFAIVP